MRTLAQDTVKQTGKTVTLQGWVNTRRDHGGLIFVDLRDHTGITQLVMQPDNAEMFQLAEQLRDEFVIEATGVVAERAEELKNPHIATGSIEVKVEELKVLNRSETPPIQVEGSAMANEDLRLNVS